MRDTYVLLKNTAFSAWKKTYFPHRKGFWSEMRRRCDYYMNFAQKYGPLSRNAGFELRLPQESSDGLQLISWKASEKETNLAEMVNANILGNLYLKPKS